MINFDEQLSRLHGDVERYRRLEKERMELRTQIEELTALADELDAVRLEEQADVDRLEGKTLTAFFFNLVGNIDEKLDKERREAYAAKVKYDTVARELAAAKEDLARRDHDLSKISNCREQYTALLEKKKAAVKAAGGESGREILSLEESIAALESRAWELREALSAGRAAGETAERVQKHLDNAEGWGTWDMLGGGTLADLAKHSELDEAQRAVEALQGCLRRFRTELADVDISEDMQVNVEGFLRFADYFFDGFFTDWTVLDKIHQAQSQVEHVSGTIERVISRLDAMLEQTETERCRTKERIDALVRDTRLPESEA